MLCALFHVIISIFAIDKQCLDDNLEGFLIELIES